MEVELLWLMLQIQLCKFGSCWIKGSSLTNVPGSSRFSLLRFSVPFLVSLDSSLDCWWPKTPKSLTRLERYQGKERGGMELCGRYGAAPNEPM